MYIYICIYIRENGGFDLNSICTLVQKQRKLSFFLLFFTVFEYFFFYNGKYMGLWCKKCNDEDPNPVGSGNFWPLGSGSSTLSPDPKNIWYNFQLGKIFKPESTNPSFDKKKTMVDHRKTKTLVDCISTNYEDFHASGNYSCWSL